MTLGPIKVGGFSVNDVLTSAEMNIANTEIQQAVDGVNGGVYTLGSKLEFGGTGGVQIDKQYLQVRSISASYTLDASGPDCILLVNTTGGGRTITLPAAQPNRRVTIKQQTGSNGVNVLPNGTDTIDGLNTTYVMTQTGSEITIVGISGGWAIIGRGNNLVSQTFLATAVSGWTAPAGCYWVDLEMCGQGGGGAGGSSGTVATSTGASGGPGAGGAKLVKRRVPVVPGTSYDVTIGSGANGGTASGAGGSGAATTFAVHGGATLATAAGGGGGTTPALVSASATICVGGTIASAAAIGANAATVNMIEAAFQGGFATNGIGGVNSTAGAPSDTGFAGGTFGAIGTASSTTLGGGGGGGGGAGAYGVGAAGNAGGAGNSSGAGSVGSPGASAAANTGAGGGGGGGGGCGSTTGGSGGVGGSGGSGQLTVYWVE